MMRVEFGRFCLKQFVLYCIIFLGLFLAEWEVCIDKGLKNFYCNDSD